MYIQYLKVKMKLKVKMQVKIKMKVKAKIDVIDGQYSETRGL